MTTKFQQFKSLHWGESPLLLGNVWDAQSAQIVAQLGYAALGTSSAAVAASLGHKDGQNISFDDYLFVIKQIAKATKLPLSVDLEFGFGDTAQAIVANLIQLHQLGVVGINLEDSEIRHQQRTLTEITTFHQKLRQITEMLQAENIEMFINLRSDAFLLGLPNALTETLARIKVYETCSIGGLFLPGITNLSEIEAVVGATSLPLNVLALPNLPDIATLKAAGVRRISTGDFVNELIYKYMKNVYQQIAEKGDFSPLFAAPPWN
jgi:2-methylisocitrate lyase-like PEP mutase family enzyme